MTIKPTKFGGLDAILRNADRSCAPAIVWERKNQEHKRIGRLKASGKKRGKAVK